VDLVDHLVDHVPAPGQKRDMDEKEQDDDEEKGILFNAADDDDGAAVMTVQHAVDVDRAAAWPSLRGCAVQRSPVLRGRRRR
jgi:hypothetical protein